MAIILLLAGHASATDPWTREDTMLQLLASGLIITDCVQTLEIAGNDDYEETNAYMGGRPDEAAVLAYFSIVLVGSCLVAWLAPTRWRKYVQGLVIGVEAGAVYHNYAIGVNIIY